MTRTAPIISTLWSIVAATALAAGCAPPATTAVQLPARQQAIFIVDTSGSMATPRPGGSLIHKVREELLRATSGTDFDRATVRLVTFDTGVQSDAQFTFPQDRSAFESRVRNLQATGKRTYVYSSLGQVLRQLNGQPDTANAIYLLTDGEDNQQPRHPISQVMAEYGARRGAFDWLFYVTLGLNTPADVRAATAGLARVQAISTPQGTVPHFSALTVRPGQLVLGNFQTTPGAHSASLEVSLNGAATSVPVSVATGDELDAHGAALTVQPAVVTADTRTLQFSLLNAGNLPEGTYHTTLCLNAPDGVLVRPEAIPVTLDYHPAPAYTVAPQPGQAKTISLPGKASQSVDYTLNGNAWAKDPVSVDVKDLPDGLQANVNGKPAPQPVLPGHPIQVTLTNTGLGSGLSGLQPTLALTPPAGTTINASTLPLPTVGTPRSFWQQWWWAIILALLLLAALIAWLIWRSIANRPW
ncbi:MAG TPA: vWA domain-containing protein, partial [Deinococcales bacterium]|nr:vWA domain-containing protein [Deinococcales bacterium]